MIEVPVQIVPVNFAPTFIKIAPTLKEKIMIVIIIIISSSFDNEKITVHVIGNVINCLIFV
jgi:hypothetical protein